MLPEIKFKFDDNIGRVKNLVTLYTNLHAGESQGRRPVNSSDVLRAATVLLHATLEEFLRGLSRWKLPAASEEVLNEIPLVGYQRADKFFLGRLSCHRGRTVDEIIEASIEKYLERSNYNNTTEITHLMLSIGVEIERVNGVYPVLTELMERRHLIVHRADRDDCPGSGHHRTRSISKEKISQWINAVVEFAARICNVLEES
jgi:hypothetical protein